MNENEEKLTVHAKMTVKPGKLEELMREMELWATSSRTESSCEYNEIVQNIEDPLIITIIEKFTHYEAFKEHMQMPAVRRFIDEVKPRLVDETYVSFHMTRIDCIGSKGDPCVEKLSFRSDLMDRP